MPGGADRELIGRLAALGVVVSGAQLERWRAAGLLPRHGRRWLGRGRGSVSVLAEETVAVAAALGRHARPGRDLRWTVIAWYAGAGLPAAPGELAVPEPPWPAVREALVWAMSRSHAQRLVVQARTAGGGGEEAQDAFYAEAGRVVGRGPAGLPHPEEVRRRVVEDPGGAWEGSYERGRRRAAVHLAAAAGMGAGEVGGEMLVEALAVLMPGVDWAPVAESARQAEGDGTLESWAEAGALIDPLARLQAAGEAEMAAARGVARILTLIGFLYVRRTGPRRSCRLGWAVSTNSAAAASARAATPARRARRSPSLNPRAETTCWCPRGDRDRGACPSLIPTSPSRIRGETYVRCRIRPSGQVTDTRRGAQSPCFTQPTVGQGPCPFRPRALRRTRHTAGFFLGRRGSGVHSGCWHSLSAAHRSGYMELHAAGFELRHEERLAPVVGGSSVPGGPADQQLTRNRGTPVGTGCRGDMSR